MEMYQVHSKRCSILTRICFIKQIKKTSILEALNHYIFIFQDI